MCVQHWATYYEAYAYRQLYFISISKWPFLHIMTFVQSGDMNRRREEEKKSRTHINSVTGLQRRSASNKVKPKNYADIRNRIWNIHILRWSFDGIYGHNVYCMQVFFPYFQLANLRVCPVNITRALGTHTRI